MTTVRRALCAMAVLGLLGLGAALAGCGDSGGGGPAAPDTTTPADGVDATNPDLADPDAAGTDVPPEPDAAHPDMKETSGPDDTPTVADLPGADAVAPDQATPDLGAPDSAEACAAGERTCINGRVATCEPPYGWLLETCPEGYVCEAGECVASACEPLTYRCSEDGLGVQVCAPDGHGWSNPMACPADQVCQVGACVAPGCDAGERRCVGNDVIECAADGLTWETTPCPQGLQCFDGACVECLGDDDCAEGLRCDAGVCVGEPLRFTTTALPDGEVGEAYAERLAAAGGVPPYTFALVGGELPAGVTLSPAGDIAGTPTVEGDFAPVVQVTDATDATAEGTFPFSVFAPASDVVITTNSPLPQGEEGTPYSTSLAATGGQSPYAWGIISGALPQGLVLTSSGGIEGTPTEHGTFGFEVRAFDAGTPVAWGTKSFELTITIAPLEIVGDQMYDLWITRVVVLPLITVVEGIPIPYSTQLQARGGVRPYHWAEQELPEFLGFLIPESGVPDGLTLDDDGTLHGAVTDPESAISVTIPFVGITLTGYFFAATVTDSQDPADSKTGIFLVPTVPIAF